jgi:Transmembrane domain of unknown function (DUF3566)
VGSPNEPGPPRTTGDGSGGTNGTNGGSNGAHEGGSAKAGAPSGDVPPWQRGTVRPPRPQDGPRAGAPAAGHSPSPDARLNRFISGGPAAGPGAGPAREAAPARESAPVPRESAPARETAPAREEAKPPNRTERVETGRPEVYASELPDLSGGQAPRTPRKAAERSGSEASTRSAAPATRATAASRSQGPVRASMQIRRFDPWSVLKVSLVLSVALFFVWMIAVAFLYLVLGGMGVWTKLNSNVGDLLTSGGGGGGELVSSGTIFGGAALIGLVNIVLLTAMATCAAFIYNLTTDLVGGVEVTLADRD